MVFPFSSTAFVMSIVAIIDAITSQLDESARWAPGQRLNQCIRTFCILQRLGYKPPAKTEDVVARVSSPRGLCINGLHKSLWPKLVGIWINFLITRDCPSVGLRQICKNLMTKMPTKCFQRSINTKFIRRTDCLIAKTTCQRSLRDMHTSVDIIFHEPMGETSNEIRLQFPTMSSELTQGNGDTPTERLVYDCLN